MPRAPPHWRSVAVLLPLAMDKIRPTVASNQSVTGALEARTGLRPHWQQLLVAMPLQVALVVEMCYAMTSAIVNND